MPQLKLHVLASGSKGNAAIVENASTGEGVLVDCGLCKRDFFARCAEAGFDPARLSGILVTHEHTDHTKCLGVVVRGLAKLGVAPALYASAEVRAASAEVRQVEDALDLRPLRAGGALSLAGMQVHVFPTSHDAAASFGFRFEAGAPGAADALGFMTDTGVVTGAAHEALRDCRVLALEGNHDAHLLETGPYPYPLKRRIASDRGHLSNDQAAAELETLLCDRLEHVVALHVSENNNTYRLPQEAFAAVIARHGAAVQVACGYQRLLTSVG